MSDTQLSLTRQQLPDGWLSTTIGEISSPKQWPTISQDILSESGYPVFGANGLIGYYTQFTHEKPTVAVTCRGSTCGTIHVTLPFSYITGNAMALDGLNEELVDTRILAAILRFQGLRACITGSAQPQIIGSDLRRVRISLPPKSEQHRIAEILDTLDDAIQKTEQLIAKLKQIKQGLLHDLLTRGIDENGKLRDPIAHPEQFKDSVFGKMPVGWSAITIGDVLEGVIDFRGRTPKKLGMNWGGGNIPALSANNVEMGKINLSKETYYGSDNLYRKWMTSGDAKRGDIVMTMEAPLGNIAQIPDERRYILSQRTILLKTRRDLIDNDFLRYQLMSDQFQGSLVRESTGTTATGIQRAKLVRIAIKVPSLDEQRMITESLQAVDENLASEETNLAKLNALKKGLMHDLLTGKVRVTSTGG